MVKSGLISGGHIRPGPDMAAGYENMAGFRPGPGPDMISGATLVLRQFLDLRQSYDDWRIHRTFTTILRPILRRRLKINF